MKKTLYVLASALVLCLAVVGTLVSSASNVMAKGDDNGISASL